MKNNQHEPKISKAERRRKQTVRIFALILALLMVGGAFYTIILFIAQMLA